MHRIWLDFWRQDLGLHAHQTQMGKHNDSPLLGISIHDGNGRRNAAKQHEPNAREWIQSLLPSPQYCLATGIEPIQSSPKEVYRSLSACRRSDPIKFFQSSGEQQEMHVLHWSFIGRLAATSFMDRSQSRDPLAGCPAEGF